MAATVSIKDNTLVVDIHGMHRFWAMKRQVIVPITHLRAAAAGRGQSRTPRGWRVGTYVPGVMTAGTYRRKDGRREFWDVHDIDKAIVIDLENDVYERLVIEVDDPAATIDLIQNAIG